MNQSKLKSKQKHVVVYCIANADLTCLLFFFKKLTSPLAITNMVNPNVRHIHCCEHRLCTLTKEDIPFRVVQYQFDHYIQYFHIPRCTMHEFPSSINKITRFIMNKNYDTGCSNPLRNI